MSADPDAGDLSEGIASASRTSSRFLAALSRSGRLLTAELRPPPTDLSGENSVDAWIDLNRAVRSLLHEERFVLFTDNAVGSREEESLQHLTSNLGQGTDLSGVVPFLTCKHTLDYCLLFARRAVSFGLEAITVTGGDKDVGPPRCVPRSRDLRRVIRELLPRLQLGAWVNPYRDAAEQVELLLDPDHRADYYVTQVVSHHRLEPLDRFLEEAARRGLRLPGLVGVFFYRSGSAKTLSRLKEFIPVPQDEISAEFASGASAASVCARTVRALADRGVEKTYISNLEAHRAGRRLETMEPMVWGVGVSKRS